MQEQKTQVMYLFSVCVSPPPPGYRAGEAITDCICLYSVGCGDKETFLLLPLCWPIPKTHRYDRPPLNLPGYVLYILLCSLLPNKGDVGSIESLPLRDSRLLLCLLPFRWVSREPPGPLENTLKWAVVPTYKGLFILMSIDISSKDQIKRFHSAMLSRGSHCL